MATAQAHLEPSLQNPPTVLPVDPLPIVLGTLQVGTPIALITGAAELAGELANVIERQKLAVTVQGKQHVCIEGWTTLGIMLGCIPREVSTTEQDGVYTAIVELVRMSDGVCLSRASAECGEESPWNKRPRYARRSMAQTRATAKACRLAFSWIMALAGYQTAPAEEMVIDDKPDEAPRTITESQRKLLEAQIRDYDLDRERVKAWIAKAWNVKHFQDLSPHQLERLLKKLERWADEAYAQAQAANARSESRPF